MKILSTVIYCSIITLSMFFVISNLIKQKIEFKRKDTYIWYFLIILIATFCCLYVNKTLKIFLLTVLFSFFIKFYFKEKAEVSILTVLLYQFMLIISELIFVIIFTTLINLDINKLMINNFGLIASNVIISLISIIMVKIPFFIKFYEYLKKITKKIKTNRLILLLLSVIIIANILSGILYYKIDFVYLLTFNTCLTIFCFIIVINSLKTQNNYIKVYDKYNTTLNSLKEYEDILDRYRVSNHENKNQLLTIRNMISNADKKTISYIDKIVENKLKDNDKIMFEVSVIPAGGLRGLIYSKILTMKDLKINYELELSNSIKTVALISLDDSLMLDICQIIGVYLDNAIDEVKKLSEKYINIEMYMEEKELVVEITNNYKGNIDIEKIENRGYSKKGKGRGYGLTLVKEIIDNNKKLSNYKKINKESFTQVLKIKM